MPWLEDLKFPRGYQMGTHKLLNVKDKLTAQNLASSLHVSTKTIRNDIHAINAMYPNSIEAIYFGLKCSDKDKKTIKNIMNSKHFVQTDIKGNVTATRPIKYYQMELDEKHFGQLKAVRLK